FGIQTLRGGLGASTVAQDTLLAEWEAWNGDSSSGQQGVRAAIRAHAADANGRGAYLSFLTGSLNNPMVEHMRLRDDGALRVPSLASDPSNPEAGLIYYNNVSNELLYYNGTSWIALTA